MFLVNLENMKATPYKPLAEISRKIAAEGTVLLKNEGNILPLSKDDTISLFGRTQIDYYKSGTGSGGMVNVDRVITIPEGLKNSGCVSVDEELEGIYELTWEQFSKHKRWNSRMKAWNITLTQAVISDSRIIFECKEDNTPCNEEEQLLPVVEEPIVSEEPLPPTVVWEKSKGINHKQIKEDVVSILNKKLHLNLERQSASRYVDRKSDIALFLMSASYTEKNSEYWYSINDENIPWMDLYSECYIAFALGSSDNVLLLTLNELKSLLPGCLRTEEDEVKNKKAHYHFSFAVDNQRVSFKQKLPTRDYIDVTKHIIR